MIPLALRFEILYRLLSIFGSETIFIVFLFISISNQIFIKLYFSYFPFTISFSGLPLYISCFQLEANRFFSGN